MTVEMIITLVALGIVVLGGIITIIIALVRGEMKQFIEEKMIEAEKSGKSGSEKLGFVLKAVSEKYKILELLLNVRKFIEKVISISKEINAKQEELNYGGNQIWRKQRYVGSG